MIETLVSTITFGVLIGAIGLAIVGFRTKARWRWYVLVSAIALPFAVLEMAAGLG